MGVSLKRWKNSKWCHSRTNRHPLQRLPPFCTSTWCPKRTLIDPFEWSMFSPSDVFTVSVEIQIKRVCFHQRNTFQLISMQIPRISHLWNILSKQLEWYSMKNLVFDFVNSVATQFMICIPPSCTVFGSEKGRYNVPNYNLGANNMMLFEINHRWGSYLAWKQTVRLLQPQMKQKLGNDHLSWCPWYIL